MDYIKKLAGDRIYLSPQDVSETNITKFTTWLNDFTVSDYLGRSSENYTESSERDYLESTAKDSSKKCFNIVTLDNDKLIGTVSLEHFDWISRSAVLGIFIGEAEYRSHGFGTEAINLILEYAFRYLNLHSVSLEVLSTNQRAIKCYQKCGFTKNGKTRDLFYVNGRYHDSIHMDILESEFDGDYIRNKNQNL